MKRMMAAYQNIPDMGNDAKVQRLILEASKAAKRDLASHFATCTWPVDQATRDAVAALSRAPIGYNVVTTTWGSAGALGGGERHPAARACVPPPWMAGRRCAGHKDKEQWASHSGLHSHSWSSWMGCLQRDGPLTNPIVPPRDKSHRRATGRASRAAAAGRSTRAAPAAFHTTRTSGTAPSVRGAPCQPGAARAVQLAAGCGRAL